MMALCWRVLLDVCVYVCVCELPLYFAIYIYLCIHLSAESAAFSCLSACQCVTNILSDCHPPAPVILSGVNIARLAGSAKCYVALCALLTNSLQRAWI